MNDFRQHYELHRKTVAKTYELNKAIVFDALARLRMPRCRLRVKWPHRSLEMFRSCMNWRQLIAHGARMWQRAKFHMDNQTASGQYAQMPDAPQILIPPPAGPGDKLKSLLGLAIIPKERWELSDPTQIEAANDTLTIKKSSENDSTIIVKIAVAQIKGTVFSPVRGRSNAFDLILWMKETNPHIPREIRQVYAGTFVSDKAFQPAYEFLRSHGFAQSPSLSTFFKTSTP